MDGKVAAIAGVVFAGVLLAGAAIDLTRSSADGGGDAAAALTPTIGTGGPANAVEAAVSTQPVLAARESDRSEGHSDRTKSRDDRESDDD